VVLFLCVCVCDLFLFLQEWFVYQRSVRPRTRAWEAVRTIVAPPSIVVECGGGIVRVFVCGVVLVVCVCDLFLFDRN